MRAVWSDVGGGLEATALGIVGEVAEKHVGESDFGAGLARWIEGDTATYVGVADKVIAPFVRDVSRGGDFFAKVIRGIDEGLVVFAKASSTWLVKLGRRALVQSFMRALMVIGVLPAVEAALLGDEVGRGRPGGLGLQVAVHAFVRAVFLRRGGMHELNLDTLLDPPKAKAGETPQAVGGERCAEITTDDLGQAVIARQVTEGLERAGELLVGAGVAGQDKVAVAVADRERVTTLPITEQEPALEVDRPHVVGLGGLRQAVVCGWVNAGPPTPRNTQPVAAKHLGNGAAGRRSFHTVFGLKDTLQLLRAPGPAKLTLVHDQRLHFLAGALGRAVWPVAACSQTLQTQLSIALQMLVSGLATDPELLAQIGHGKPPAAREHHESIDLFHWS